MDSKAFEYRYDDMSNVFNNYLTMGGYNANTEITDEKVLHLSKKFGKEMLYASEKYIEKINEVIEQIET